MQLYFWAIAASATSDPVGSEGIKIAPRFLEETSSYEPCQTRWWLDRRMCQYGQGRLTSQRWVFSMCMPCSIENRRPNVLIQSSTLQAPYSQHSHHKSQTFTVQKGYAVEQPCMVAETVLSTSFHEAPQDVSMPGHVAAQSSRHTASMSRTPKWIENDGKASTVCLSNLLDPH